MNLLRSVSALALLLVSGLVNTAIAQSRALTHSEGTSSNAIFRVLFERPVVCPTSFANAPSGASVLITLDCRYGLGTTAVFELFDHIRLNPPWTVSSFTSTSGAVIATPGGANPRTRVRLSASAGTMTTSTLTIMITPSLLPGPVPECRAALNQRPRDFVCISDSDCPATIAGQPSQVCSSDCGNRCLPK